MSLSKKEYRQIDGAVLAAFLASGQPMKKELCNVPPCAECGTVPVQYSRHDDGRVFCLDRGACYARQDVQA